MKTSLQMVGVALLMVLTNFAIAAEPPAVTPMTAEERDDALRAQGVAKSALATERFRLGNERLQLDTQQAAEVYKTRNAIFRRQLTYDPIILIMVIATVAAGVGLSYLQMKKGLTAGEAGMNSLEIGRDGLKIRSPVIGLLILVVSLGFFYLYLIEVYRLKGIATYAVPPDIGNLIEKAPAQKQLPTKE